MAIAHIIGIVAIFAIGIASMFLNKINMGRISKYSNLYDKNGERIRSVDSVSGRLEDYSIGELEALVDELAKDETKRTAYTNSMSVLMRMYETKGNPHKDEIIQKLNDYAKSKTTKAEVTEALNEAKEDTVAA